LRPAAEALTPSPPRSARGRSGLKEESDSSWGRALKRRLEEQAALLQEAEAELADLDGRLKEAQSGRARAAARCRELTSEVERLSAAGEALEALETLVRRSH
jgi:peptidoglycan hydrolase CwlO-like protein